MQRAARSTKAARQKDEAEVGAEADVAVAEAAYRAHSVHCA